MKKPNKIVENGITIIELTNTKTAFSFFNMLFIDPELPQKSTILKHEMAHIHQKHSFDVLFFELIRSLSWFNPIVHFLKNDIKLLHEYLADEETTKKGIEKYEYAIFLIQNSYGDQAVQLTNQIFNSSILKRRISMLNQKKSAKWARLRLLLVLPVVGGMLCASTMAFTKDYGVIDLYPKPAKTSTTFQDTTKKVKAKEVRISEPVQKASKAKAKEIVIEEPVQPAKKIKDLRLAPPPPPIEPAPKTKSAKKPSKSMAPPPPPVEPKLTKEEAAETKLSPPPPPIEPPAAPAKKDLTERVVKGYPLKGVQIKKQPAKSEAELTPLKVKGIKISDKTSAPPPPPIEPARKKGN
ncbi:MAG: M56 family metallopeptidase [Pedobacter sp.]|nr:MAG: M56 family metallopeptidase [Pedobacter sp.]